MELMENTENNFFILINLNKTIFSYFYFLPANLIKSYKKHNTHRQLKKFNKEEEKRRRQ